MLREGDNLEREGRWEDARQAYAKAVALDALYEPAKTGLEVTLNTSGLFISLIHVDAVTFHQDTLFPG